MKIIWSNFAIETLKEIIVYYKQAAGYKIARKIKTQIFKSTKQLIKHPKSGQLEETLKVLDEGHRYLVVGNYKLVWQLNY